VIRLIRHSPSGQIQHRTPSILEDDILVVEVVVLVARRILVYLSYPNLTRRRRATRRTVDVRRDLSTLPESTIRVLRGAFGVVELPPASGSRCRRRRVHSRSQRVRN
jgi:hypothetical protein